MMIALVLVSCIAGFALIGAFLAINSVLVFNSIPYMAVAPDILRRDTRYLRKLPNLLKVVYDAGLQSPWPPRSTALAAFKFRRRLETILKDAVPDAPQVIQHHLSLWAFVQLHQGELRQIILRRQMQRACRILNESLDAGARDRVLAFMARCRKGESRAARCSGSPASEWETLDWLARLRCIDAILSEHGYRLSDEFSTLERWDDADDAAIMHELASGSAHG